MTDTSSNYGSRPPEARRPRPFVGVLFRCCRVYQRLYLRPDGSAFAGCCPRCGARVTLVVDPRGADSRFFEVGG